MESNEINFLHEDSIFLWIDDNKEIISNAIERNYERWDDFIGEYIWIEPEPVPESYDEEFYYENWILNRLLWMDMEMPGDCNNTNFQEANIMTQTIFSAIVDLLGRPAYNTKSNLFIYITTVKYKKLLNNLDNLAVNEPHPY